MTSSPTIATMQRVHDLPPEIVKMIRDGTAVVASLHVLKATYETHFAKNPIFPCDIIVTDIGHALHDDVVVLKIEHPSTWTKKAVQPSSNGQEQQQKSAKQPKEEKKEEVGDDDENNDDDDVDNDEVINDNDDVDDGDDSDEARNQAAIAQHLRHADGREIKDGVKGRAEHEKKAELCHLLQAKYCNDGDLTSTRKDDYLGQSLRDNWNPTVQPRGSVEYVVQRKKPTDRLQSCLFYLQPTQPKPPLPIRKERWYRFKSYNASYPFIAIFGADIPAQFQNETIADFLYMVQLNELGTGYAKDEVPENWADGKYPVGKVIRSIGSAGTVEAESIAITATNQIRDFPFSDDVLACVAESCPIPSKEELKTMGRADLRESEFVTTIDPATARDLDDALSICAVPGGYRVGVHIADVSNFVPKDTALDFEASQRCTSTYLVERVVPMLPSKLCEDYCSLNAGVDKFAFSGIWHFDTNGNVLSEWFGQSLIRNRCRMTYEDAQIIIEGNESGDSLKFVNEDTPRDELVKKVVDSTKMLYALSLKLKERRIEKGAISLGKKKLSFVFENMNSRLAPIGFKFDTQKEANRLVEEFMLWANFRVAEKVFEFLPRVTLLRQHSPPVKQKLERFVEQAKRHGYSRFSTGGSTGKALREALDSYKDDKNYAVLSFMVVICMSLAKYVCASQGMSNAAYESDDTNDKAARLAAEYMAAHAGKRGHQFEKNLDDDQKPKEHQHQNNHKKGKQGGSHKNEQEDSIYLGHYALAAPYYCHFTSPIRRFADLITHRQLLLALDIEREIKENGADPASIDIDSLEHGHYYYEEDEIMEIAVRCNKMKELAKKCGAMSGQLFLSVFLDALKEKETRRLIGLAIDSAGPLVDNRDRNRNSSPASSANATNNNKDDKAVALASPSTRAPKEVNGKQVKYYATGIVVRTAGTTFTVQLRELALEVEIYHNAKVQLWEGENDVDEDSGDFKIQWPGCNSKEECSIFSEFVGEVITIQNPITQIYFIILPPNKRQNLPLVTENLRLDQ